MAADACVVCDQRLSETDAACSNVLCSSPTRRFTKSFAVAMKTGPLETAIWRYKFDDQWGWGIIFARVLLGFLYDNPGVVESDDMIIASPTYRVPGASIRLDHTGYVISQAADQDDRGLPFVHDPPVIVKTRPTQKLKDMGSAARRQESKALRAALEVPDESRVKGRDVFVYDDVFTTGTTLNVVAGVLSDAGARRVYGLTLARQPWSG